MKWQELLPKKMTIHNCRAYQPTEKIMAYNLAIDNVTKALEGKIISLDSVSVEEIRKEIDDFTDAAYIGNVKLARAIKSLLERKARR
jgi:hypothetical protein